MNERIKELAHKADFIGKKNNGAEWRWGYIDPELAEKLEKFAELIVKECCLALWTEECHTSDLAFDEVRRNATRIKEHFGIDTFTSCSVTP